jgi:hypothetical protein
MKVKKRLGNVFKGITFSEEYVEFFLDGLFFVIYTKDDDENHFYFPFTPYDFAIPIPFPVNYFIEISKQIQDLQD